MQDQSSLIKQLKNEDRFSKIEEESSPVDPVIRFKVGENDRRTERTSRVE